MYSSPALLHAALAMAEFEAAARSPNGAATTAAAAAGVAAFAVAAVAAAAAAAVGAAAGIGGPRLVCQGQEQKGARGHLPCVTRPGH